MLLTRHGETIWNRIGRMQGALDSPLTRKGIAQAKRVAETLNANLSGDIKLRMIASPQGRAYQTAVIIAEGIGQDPVKIEQDKTLREVDWGEWNGLTRSEIAYRDPEIWLARQHDKWSTRPKNGESYQDLADRLATWLADHQDDRALMVVAHGAVSRVLRGLYLQLPRDEILTLEEPQGVYFDFRNGQITRHPEA